MANDYNPATKSELQEAASSSEGPSSGQEAHNVLAALHSDAISNWTDRSLSVSLPLHVPERGGTVFGAGNQFIPSKGETVANLDVPGWARDFRQWPHEAPNRTYDAPTNGRSVHNRQDENRFFPDPAQDNKYIPRRPPEARPDSGVPIQTPGDRYGVNSPPVAVDSAAVRRYLSGSGSGSTLPQIAHDFRAIGLTTLREQDARDDANPNKIHVSSRGGGANTFTSIQQAVDRAQPGTVIQVQGGEVFRERVSINKSGITLRTDPRNPAVIDLGSGAKGRGSAGISVGSGVSDVAIKNFEVRNFSGLAAGISVDGQNIRNVTISGNNVHSASGAEAIRVYGRGGTEQSAVTGINIISNTVHGLRLRQLESIPINGNVSGFKVIGNIAYDTDNLFIDTIGGEGKGKGGVDAARNGLIEYNYGDGITSTKNASYRYGPSAAGFYSDGGKDLVVRYNYFKNCDYGIELNSEHPGRAKSSGIQTYGNILENSKLAWIIHGGGNKASGNTIVNNIVIGGAKTEGSFGGSRLGNNPSFTSGGVNRLPAPIAELLQQRSNPGRQFS